MKSNLRVYVSSTSIDLKEHRAIVITALRKMGVQPVCMEEYVAQDKLPMDKCLDDVAHSDVYVGIIARRYGFIPSGYDKSITELEYRTACEAGIPTLIFLLEESTEWPPEYCDTGQKSEDINRLRDELKLCKLVGWFHSQHQLASEVQSAVHKILIENEPTACDSIPINLPRLRGLFVNRENELDTLTDCLKAEDNKLVVIIAPGGYGKTELVAMALKEIGPVPSKKKGDINGILYLKCIKGDINLGHIFSESGKIAGKQDKFLNVYTCEDMTTGKKLEYFFAEMSRVGNVIIVMDNFEDLLDQSGNIRDSDLREFLETAVAIEHTVRIFVTSRALPRFNGSRNAVKIDLSSGLPEDKAMQYLRKEGFQYGLDSEPEDNLRGFVRRVHCIPKALESVLGYLEDHYPAIRFSDIVSDKKLFEDFDRHDLESGLKALISQQFNNLSQHAKLVLSVLSIFPKPVPKDAVIFFLKGIDAAELASLLTRLERNRLVIHSNGFYDLHPIVRSFIYEWLPEGTDSEERGGELKPAVPVFAKQGLHRQAAQFYQSIPSPPYGDRTSLDDIEPMFDAIGHLLAADLAEEAAALFLDNALHEDLHWWGYYDLLSDYCRRFLDCNISPDKKVVFNIQLGKSSRNLGKKEEAKSIYENALPLIDAADDPESKIGLLNALGDIHYYLGNHDLALDYLKRAEELLKVYPNAILRSENTGDIGNVMFSLEKHEEAKRLYEQSIVHAREADNKTGKIYEGIWNGDLGNVYSSLFDKTADPLHRKSAIKHYRRAIDIAKEANDRRHESHFSGLLGNLFRQSGEYDLAEEYLRTAFSISENILYGRLIDAQAKGLVDLYIKKQDFEKVYKVCLAFQQVACKIGNSEKVAEAERLLAGAEHLFIEQMLHRIVSLFQDGQIGEAIIEGERLVRTFAERPGVCDSLGSIFTQCGRQSALQDFFQLSVEAYTNAITASSDDSRHSFFSKRADAYALLRKNEEAIADYGEAIKREPDNTDAALSRAEVQIWSGRYAEAKISLEALHPKLAAIEKKAICAWLMCHALNLLDLEFSVFQKALEDQTKVKIDSYYNVRDIEIYLQRLDQTKFSEKQIKNAWMIQSLIIKLSG